MSKKLKNYGLVIEEPRAQDYRFLGATEIPFKVLQEDGQWDEYLPTIEYQKYSWGDSYGCVTFSALNCLEILHNRLYGDEMNWSDRFTVKRSGTVPRYGNSMRAVAESIRKEHGFVDQPVWTNETSSEDEFYSEIPANVNAKGMDMLNEYDVGYEWIEPVSKENLMEALKTSPIQIAVRTDWYIKDDKYYLKEIGAPNHCITLYGYKEFDYWKTFDHYNGKEYRKLDWDFFIGYAMKFTIKKKDMMTFYKKEGDGAVYQLGADGLYHPIAYERFFLDLYGEWVGERESFLIETVDIPDDKVGYPIGGYQV